LSSQKIDKDIAIKLASKGFAIIHEEYNKSVIHFLNSPEFTQISPLLLNPQATIKYSKFWHTSQGPWSNVLKNIVPAVNNSIPSIYENLPNQQKEIFDEHVFIKGIPPPKELILLMLKWTCLHSLTTEKVRKFETSAKRNKRWKSDKPIKEAPSRQVELDEITARRVGL
jgi:hypothetical protein